MNHDYTETKWEKIESTLGFVILLVLIFGGAIMMWPK